MNYKVYMKKKNRQFALIKKINIDIIARDREIFFRYYHKFI